MVNTVLNTLVHAGELSDDAEVSVCVLLSVFIFVIVEYSCGHGSVHFEVGELKNSC